MSEQIRPIDDNDLSKNWVNSSRFLFYVSVFCLLAFVFGCSFRLWNQRYKGNGNPVIPESTQYSPSYPAVK